MALTSACPSYHTLPDDNNPGTRRTTPKQLGQEPQLIRLVEPGRIKNNAPKQRCGSLTISIERARKATFKTRLKKAAF